MTNAIRINEKIILPNQKLTAGLVASYAISRIFLHERGGKVNLKQAIIVLALAFAGPLHQPVEAKQIYAAYEGPDAVKVGLGGTRITKNGIDYWTNGAPPRPFRVVGLVTDSRKSGMWSGDALGSPAIASITKKAGGSAVIIISAETRVVGVAGFGSSFGSGSATYGNGWASMFGSAFGSSYSEAVDNTTTQMLVIKYLTSEEIDAAKASADAETALDAERSPIPSPISARSAQATQDGSSAPSGQSGPIKRPAKTQSGFCYDVPRGYAGTGSVSRPIVTSATPACFSLLED